jgi:surface protein
MGLMFVGCESLTTVPLLSTSNVTDMTSMFSSCHSLVEIPTLDTSKSKFLAAMFAKCSSLKQIPLLNTKSCIHMNGMFEGCTSLETVPILDASNVGDISKIFKDCPSLVMLGGLKNLGMSYSSAYYIHENKREYTLDLSYSPLLTHDSLMNIINNLYDIKSKGVKPQTLQLGDTNRAKLTAEEIAIATNKGWNVI